MESSPHAESIHSPSRLHCEVVTDFSHLERISADWDRLWRSDPNGEIFQSFAWTRAWWRSYGDKVSLCSLVVLEADRVVGILPLVKDGKRLFFLGGRQADYGAVICENARAAEVVRAALEKLLQLPGWNECVLSNLKANGQMLQQSGALPRELRHHLQRVSLESCYTILLTENRDVLTSLLRNDHTRRRLNKLRKAGALGFRHVETKSEAHAQLSEMLRHHTRRRALAGKEHITPEFCRFLQNLVDELDLTRELRFGVLELNGRPLAWHLSFHVNGKLLFYQQCFDVDFWDYSPGEVLIHELTRYVKENVAREFDFAHGDEPFKNRFTTHRRKSYSLYVDRSGFRGRSRRLLRVVRIAWIRLWQGIASLAKKHDRTFQMFRVGRLWWRGVLARIRFHRRERTLLAWLFRRAMRFLRTQDDAQIHLLSADCRDCGDNPVKKWGAKLTVTNGTLSDLVDLSFQHPDIIVPSELTKYRRRLKKGDRVYLLRDGDDVMLVGWVSVSEFGELASATAGQPGSGAAPMMLLDECWVLSKNPEDAYCWPMHCALLQEANKKQLLFGICCRQQAAPLTEMKCGKSSFN
jgi:CelD/BcsL family acetyltransferase involved in cellulose biosynthesis